MDKEAEAAPSRSHVEDGSSGELPGLESLSDSQSESIWGEKPRGEGSWTGAHQHISHSLGHALLESSHQGEGAVQGLEQSNDLGAQPLPVPVKIIHSPSVPHSSQGPSEQHNVTIKTTRNHPPPPTHLPPHHKDTPSSQPRGARRKLPEKSGLAAKTPGETFSSLLSERSLREHSEY